MRPSACPYLGRFLQTDPIGYADGLNPYIYCGNNSVNWVDPYGLCKEQLINALENWLRTAGILDPTGFAKIAADEVAIGHMMLDYYKEIMSQGVHSPAALACKTIRFALQLTAYIACGCSVENHRVRSSDGAVLLVKTQVSPRY